MDRDVRSFNSDKLPIRLHKIRLARFAPILGGGAVIGLEVRYKDIHGDVVVAGMNALAMMPRGHIVFFAEGGQSTLSMLECRTCPRFIPVSFLFGDCSQTVYYIYS